MVVAGVCAALHVGKLAPAIAALQQALGLSLLQAGFLLGGVQAAGMAGGLLLGLLADRLGGRRSLITGLLVLAAASAAGAVAQGATALLALRAVEGVGFLLVALPAPGLVRALVPPERTAAMLGLWGAYMPLATALALLVGPLWVGGLGWRSWWWALAALSALMAAVVWRCVPRPAAVRAPLAAAGWTATLQQTLASGGPWLVAAAFAVYSGQWLAVIGFLPTIYTQAGVSGAATGVLTALAAAVNIGGNVAAGRLLQRGVTGPRLLAVGYACMALAALAAFATLQGQGLPAALRYTAVLAFSGLGGLIPGTLFSLALRVAPGEHAVATTVGWMQQWSSAGQFAGPPVVAALAAWAGGWQLSWVFTVACSAAGLLLAAALGRRLRR